MHDVHTLFGASVYKIFNISLSPSKMATSGPVRPLGEVAKRSAPANKMRIIFSSLFQTAAISGYPWAPPLQFTSAAPASNDFTVLRPKNDAVYSGGLADISVAEENHDPSRYKRSATSATWAQAYCWCPFRKVKIGLLFSPSLVSQTCACNCHLRTG